MQRPSLRYRARPNQTIPRTAPANGLQTRLQGTRPVTLAVTSASRRLLAADVVVLRRVHEAELLTVSAVSNLLGVTRADLGACGLHHT